MRDRIRPGPVALLAASGGAPPNTDTGLEDLSPRAPGAVS